MLKPYCKNVIKLVGVDSTKQKRHAMEQLRIVKESEDMVVVATGRYVGEGFDLPRLDTLFLALPVSWKGVVAQYAGRLHREYDGKMTCQIYDYVDIGNAICEKMYRRRLRAYKSIGYTTVNSADDVEKCGYIYDGRDFTEQFIKDIGCRIGYANTKLDCMSEVTYKNLKKQARELIAVRLHLVD
jgi:superfamily II DNA or RNA helicase